MEAPALPASKAQKAATASSTPALIHTLTFSPLAKLSREAADLNPLRKLVRRGDAAAQELLEALGADPGYSWHVSVVACTRSVLLRLTKQHHSLLKSSATKPDLPPGALLRQAGEARRQLCLKLEVLPATDAAADVEAKLNAYLALLVGLVDKRYAGSDAPAQTSAPCPP